MKRWLLLLALIASPLTQAITLEQLQQRLANQPVVRADFAQQRQIKGMPRPLLSSGKLMIVSDRGLWWQQTTPFPLTMVLDDRRMVQVMNGQSPEIITADANPQLFQFNHLLRALFQADSAVLEQNFALNFSEREPEHWQLELRPITSPLDQLFNTITLQGQEYVNRILLDDRQGDRTTLTFSNQQLTPTTLTADEQQRFVF